MTKFFDSNLIKNELDSIHELQLECFENAFVFDKMPHESQKEHIDNLLTLLDKQKIMYARLCLTDDPEAKKMKKHIEESAKQMGLPTNVDMNILFANMNNMVSMMRQQIDKESAT